MTSTRTPAPVIVKITNHLPLIEKILLTALAIGTILTAMGTDSNVTTIGLLGLGVTFFLYAYRAIDIPGTENDQFKFSELLGLMIVPKVLWISSAISAVGISMYLIDVGNEGYKQMLIIGGLSIGIGTALLLIFLIRGVRHITLVASVLLRAIPLFVVDMYLLFN